MALRKCVDYREEKVGHDWPKLNGSRRGVFKEKSERASPSFFKEKSEYSVIGKKLSTVRQLSQSRKSRAAEALCKRRERTTPLPPCVRWTESLMDSSHLILLGRKGRGPKEYVSQITPLLLACRSHDSMFSSVPAGSTFLRQSIGIGLCCNH